MSPSLWGGLQDETEEGGGRGEVLRLALFPLPLYLLTSSGGEGLLPLVHCLLILKTYRFLAANSDCSGGSGGTRPAVRQTGASLSLSELLATAQPSVFPGKGCRESAM